MEETKLEETLRKFAETKEEISDLTVQQEEAFARFLKDINISEDSNDGEWFFELLFNSYSKDFEKLKLEEILCNPIK
jgi:hypothetical protein